MSLEYKIDVLGELKNRGYNTNVLRKNRLLAEGVIQSLRTLKPISWSNIEKICELLECQPGDILVMNNRYSSKRSEAQKRDISYYLL